MFISEIPLNGDRSPLLVDLGTKTFFSLRHEYVNLFFSLRSHLEFALLGVCGGRYSCQRLMYRLSLNQMEIEQKMFP
jgi:hypothetical protein